jgi:uncharacterized protein involved in exopolysaccharide biosynthesis
MDERNAQTSALPGFLTDPRGVLERRWRWMLAGSVLCAVVASAVVAVLPQSYEASSRLLFSSQRIPEDFVRSTSQESVDEQVNAMIGEVLSRVSLEEVVRGHSLAPEGEETAEALYALRAAIEIEPEKAMATSSRGEPSRIFSVRVTWNDPVLAADLANDLVSRFIAAHADRRGRQVRLATEFLRRGMENAERELREQSAKLTEFKERYRGELPTELETKLARLERLQAQRQSLALQISEAEARMLTVRASSGAVDSRAKLIADLRAKLVHEQAVHTDEHPNVLSMKRQIAELEAAPPEPVPVASYDPAAAAIAAEVAALRRQTLEIESEMQELDRQVGHIPARQEELDAMLRREEMLREAFADASRKLQDAELAENLEQAQQGIRLTRLEQAVPPNTPKYPKPLLFLGALLASLGFGAAVGVLFELLDPVVLTGSDLETATGLPLLGVVPRAH